ncbi:WD40 repeat domain-containing protein [Streptomyces sp. NPDC005251]|uniref:WD40 repeat domain-containing protein n=1 Tax=Streptomyces sp. NPDC005251 TaxID=3157166 RepID=UPI0033BCF2C7
MAAVAASVRDLGQVLVERCGLDEGSLRMLLDPVEPGELGRAVAEEVERTTGVLWFHYVGHGLVSLGGHLHLATGATLTQPGWLAYTALPYASVRDSLLSSEASALVVTLDCCFSGRAVGFLGPDPEGMEAELARVNGGFVLAAAAREELALAPAGSVHTAFTGELIRLLRQGDPKAGPQLTLLGASRCLQRSLGERGLPVPREHASGRAGELVLCSNPAYRPPEATEAPAEAWEADEQAAAAVCPYPGLVPFGPEQVQWFFGRTDLLKQLTEQLSRRMEVLEPLVVIGPSGAGKSSLLGAGLLPALGRGEVGLPGSASWPHVRLTPTGRPLAALAGVLARFGAGDAEEISAALAVRPDRVCDFVMGVLAARAGGQGVDQVRLVVVVDQFEEVFALCEDAGERQAFVRALSAAAGGRGGVPCALVVIGVRADFYADCLAQPGVQSALERAVVVGPLTAAGLAEAITEPAQLCRLKLQAGLVELVLRDLGLEAEGDGAEETADAGALPLLAHALRAVWERREGRTLTLAGYRQAGGVHGAIAATADACYDGLGTEALQELARTLLLRLVQVGDKTDTRRRVHPADLLKGLPAPDASLVLDALTDARLVTRDIDTVEIAHEVLIRAWPRLRAWVKEDRAGLLIRQRLAAAAAQWEAAGRPDSDLRQQTVLLGEEVAWSTTAPAHLRATAVERDFLNASVAFGRRRARTRRVLRTVVGVLSVLALIGGLLAWQRSKALSDDRLQAAARNIAARADTLRRFDPQVAQLLNVAAWKTAHVAEARSGLLTAAVQQDQDTFSLPDLSEAEFHLSRDDRVMVAVDKYGAVRVWDVAAKELTRKFRISVPHGDGTVRGVAVSSDGRTIAVQSGRSVELWSTTRGRRVAGVFGDSGSQPLVMDSVLRRLVLVTHGRVEVWDTARHRLLLRVPHPATVAELGRGGRLALCNWPQIRNGLGTSLQLWDLRTRRSISTHLSSAVVCDEGSLGFSPDGKLLAAPVFTSQASGQFQTWDTRTGRSSGPFSAFHVLGPGFPFSVSVAFSPDGKRLAISDEQRLELLSLSDEGSAPDGTYQLVNEDVELLAFAPDSHTVRFLRGNGAGPAVRTIDVLSGIARSLTAISGASTISADGQVVAVQSPSGGRNSVRIIEASTGKAAGPAVTTLHVPDTDPAIEDVSPMALSGDGQILVLGDPGASTATVWDTRAHRESGELAFSSEVVGQPSQSGGGLFLSTDGTVVAAALDGGQTVQVLRVETGKAIRTVRHVKGQLLAISADGHRLVTDAGEIIDVLSGRTRHGTLARYATATQAAFSPDGSLLAATDYAGGLALWNGTASKRLTYLDGGSAYSYGNGTRARGGLLAFSSNGRLLAVQHPLNPTVQLWDTRTLRTLGTPLPLNDRMNISGMAFEAGERSLRVVGTENDLSWEQSASRRGIFLSHSTLAPDTLVNRLCRRVGRDLTPPEWALYIPDLPYRRVCT